MKGTYSLLVLHRQYLVPFVISRIVICATPFAAAQSDASTATLRVTSREVLVDVIALDGRNNSVLNLKLEDLQVSESTVEDDSLTQPLPVNAPVEPEIITSLRVIDPDALPSEEGTQGGFQIKASCRDHSSWHYRLAFRPGPDARRSGFHRISITTKLPAIKLFYRRKYYVGLTEPPAKPLVVDSSETNKLLLQAACYHADRPLSISLRAKSVNAGRTDVLRYSVAIDPDSLTFVTLEKNSDDAGVNRHIALDYGACNLDNWGLPINFFHASLDTVLTSGEYARALDRGFPHLLELSTPESTAMTRVVVRDRATGNLGAADIPLVGSDRGQTIQTSAPPTQTFKDLKTVEAWLNLDSMRYNYGHSLNPLYIRPEATPVGSFGTTVSIPHSFCGDVYDLPNKPVRLPDFRESDPIASLYTSTLDVPYQLYSNSTRIPGEPPGTSAFGIEYHGMLWITSPGEYQFLMLSDDGAILRIDDKKLIDIDGVHGAEAASGHLHLDSGRHAIEVMYFEDAKGLFALELWVKPPNARSWTLFDMNNFAPPASGAQSSFPVAKPN